MIQSQYDFSMPGRVVFGWGRTKELPELIRPLGHRVHIFCGSRTILNTPEFSGLLDLLKDAGLELAEVELQTGEPTVQDVDRLAESKFCAGVSAEKGDVFLGIGGGSAIDLAKAVSAMVPNWELAEKNGPQSAPTVRYFLEGVGIGLKLEKDPIPTVFMPTTAGSGAEATKNAVIASHDPPFKKSLRDVRLFARAVLIDPQWTVRNSPEVTACSGMDALTQLFESFLSRNAAPIPQALAFQGLSLGFHALETAFRDPENREAREKMAHAAFLSGLCLANSGLGLAHGIAPALGMHAQVPHGKACALLLSHALRINADVCRERLLMLAAALFPNVFFSNEDSAVEKLIYEVNVLTNSLQIPRRLSEIGVRRDQLEAIAADSKGNSMNGNPKMLKESDVLQILEEIF